MLLRRLVINADDAGIDVPRNDGIFELHAAGVLRSATVLAMGRGFEDFAARALQAPTLGVGVHLNLSHCCPPAGAVGVRGAFVAKELLWERALAGELDGEEIEAEFAAQLERVLRAGLTPTHVDGHNHIHVFPCAAEALDRLESRYPFVARRRQPFEFEGASTPSSKSARFAALVRTRRRGAGPAHFAGFCLEGQCSVERLFALFEVAPGESLELMVHPGRCAYDSVPYSAEPQRERELEALLDPRLGEWLARHGVSVLSWREFLAG